MLLALLFATFLARTASGDEQRLSISGYDPVAYFTDGIPVQGKSELEYSWHRLRWRFVSGEHRDLFMRDPKHYAPQYDGYCAMGVSENETAHKDTVDPEAWAIVDGKLYLAHNRYFMQAWRESAKQHILQADQDWEVVKDLPAPEIVGPPCATSPYVRCAPNAVDDRTDHHADRSSTSGPSSSGKTLPSFHPLRARPCSSPQRPTARAV
jgi:hypothetical protein